MIPKRLQKFLEAENVNYEIVDHESWKSENKSVTAKACIVKAESKDVMVIIPATRRVDLSKLSVVLGTESLELESEKEYSSLFPDCKEGKTPPLGRPYNLPCYLDETILDFPDVLFESGNPKEAIKVSSDEFWRIAHAEVGNFRSRIQ